MSSLSAISGVWFIPLPEIWWLLIFYQFFFPILTSVSKKVIYKHGLAISTSIATSLCHSFLSLQGSLALRHDYIKHRLHSLVQFSSTSCSLMYTFRISLLSLLRWWNAWTKNLIIVSHKYVCLCKIKWHERCRWLLFAVRRWRRQHLLLLCSRIRCCCIIESVQDSLEWLCVIEVERGLRVRLLHCTIEINWSRHRIVKVVQVR